MACMEDGSGFMCLLCNKVAIRKGDMKMHVETQHLDAGPHECQHCGKQFKNKNTLKNHISLTHRIK